MSASPLWPDTADTQEIAWLDDCRVVCTAVVVRRVDGGVVAVGGRNAKPRTSPVGRPVGVYKSPLRRRCLPAAAACTDCTAFLTVEQRSRRRCPCRRSFSSLIETVTSQAHRWPRREKRASRWMGLSCRHRRHTGLRVRQLAVCDLGLQVVRQVGRAVIRAGSLTQTLRPRVVVASGCPHLRRSRKELAIPGGIQGPG